MSTLIGINAPGHTTHRERTRVRVRAEVAGARREDARDMLGVALGVGVGTALWLVLAWIARLIG